MRTIKQKHLDQLLALLDKSKEPLTANQIAKKLRCSRDAVLRRIAKLEESKNIGVGRTYVREGRRGPESVAFSW